MSLATLALCVLAPATQAGIPTTPQLTLQRTPPAPVGIHVVVGLGPQQNIDDVLNLLPFAAVVDEIPGHSVYQIEVNAGSGQIGIDAVLAGLKAAPGVNFAEPIFQVRIPSTEACAVGSGASAQQCTIAFVDGDPTAGEYAGQPALGAIGLDLVSRETAPGTPIVAIVDTGIDFGHPLFDENIYSIGYDFISGQEYGQDLPDGLDNDADGFVDEALGHGTHVAGTILRVAPTALLIPYRALTSEGNGSAFHLAQAIYAAIDDGAHLINLSVSLTEPAHVVAGAILAARDAGVAVFTSSGNTASAFIPWPGSMEVSALQDFSANPGYSFRQGIPEQIALVTVGAVTPDDLLCSFSSWGAAVDLVAPGQDVYSSLYGGEFGWWSGTSMATAVATGGAALLLALDPSLTSLNAAQDLVYGAQSIDKTNPDFVGGLGQGRLYLPNSLAK